MSGSEGARWNSDWEPKDESRGEGDTYLHHISQLEKELADAKAKLNEQRTHSYEISVPSSVADTCVVTEVLKSAGDKVSAEDIVIKMTHGSRTLSVRASVYGEIDKIFCSPGDTVKKGTTLAKILSGFKQNHQPRPAVGSQQTTAPSAKTDLTVPISDISVYKNHWPNLAEDCFIRKHQVDKVEAQKSDASARFIRSITQEQSNQLSKYDFIYLSLAQMIKFHEAGFYFNYKLEYWLKLRSQSIVSEKELSDDELENLLSHPVFKDEHARRKAAEQKAGRLREKAEKKLARVDAIKRLFPREVIIGVVAIAALLIGYKLWRP